MYQVGDYVVKAGEGVCRIEDTVRMDSYTGIRDQLYFLLIPLTDSRIRVYLPVAEEYGDVRHVISRGEAEALIREIGGIEPTEIESDKMREQIYKDAIKSCDPRRLVGIIKNMFLRSRERQRCGKKNTAVDERYFALAEKALYSELGFVLSLDDLSVRDLITKTAEAERAAV